MDENKTAFSPRTVGLAFASLGAMIVSFILQFKFRDSELQDMRRIKNGEDEEE